MNWIKKQLLKFFAKRIAKKIFTKENTMDTKKWWASKTIWSDVLTIVLAIITLVDKITGSNTMSSELLVTILTVLGAIGINGRVTADKKIQ